MNRWTTLLLFLLLVVGGGLVIGWLTMPGAWYAGLTKPWFNPPNWIFGPVWTGLYILIAIAGWRLWQIAPHSRAMYLWWIQLALNFAWSPLFFGAHAIGAALGVIVLLLATIVMLIASAHRHDRVIALMMLPYAAWVAFATALNAAIWWLN